MKIVADDLNSERAFNLVRPGEVHDDSSERRSWERSFWVEGVSEDGDPFCHPWSWAKDHLVGERNDVIVAYGAHATPAHGAFGDALSPVLLGDGGIDDDVGVERGESFDVEHRIGAARRDSVAASRS